MTLFLSVTAFAEPSGQSMPARRDVMLHGKPVALEVFKDLRLELSANCRKPDGSLGCAAARATLDASIDGLSPALEGGAEPGSVVCTYKLKGRVVRAVTKSGDDLTYCVFPDQSLVATDSLSVFATDPEKKEQLRARLTR